MNDPRADLLRDMAQGAEPITKAPTAAGLLVWMPLAYVLRGILRVYVRRTLLPQLSLDQLYSIHAELELALPEGRERAYAQRQVAREIARRARAGY